MRAHTGRAATSWLEAPNGSPGTVSITLGDVQAFMETCSNVTERQLDLRITSPGGFAEAAESIVEYLRTRFDHIRVIVPLSRR